MVTWKRSFIVAIKILIVQLLWWILGSIILIAVAGAALIGMRPPPPGATPEDYITWAYGLLGTALLFGAIGIIIAVIGATATLVKFIVDEAVSEAIEKTAKTSLRQPPAPSFGAGLPPSPPGTPPPYQPPQTR